MGKLNARHTPKKQRKPNNKISTHFAKRDFVCKCGHCESAIKISLGLVGGLELLRTLAQNRINIIRAYMCADAVEKQRSVKRNFYSMGIAADITIDNLDPRTVARMAMAIPEFRGVGLNLDENYVHVDTRKAPEPVFWVEHHQASIPITDDNRVEYLGNDPLPELPSDAISELS
ncbi:hypothetical protein EBR96_08730 [bacterium]|nr:hypothetical protein [bacterium]